MSTISFELHAKVAEIDPEMCSYGQLSEVQMDSDLDLDLGSGQDRINIPSMQHTHYVSDYQRSQARDCSITHYYRHGRIGRY